MCIMQINFLSHCYTNVSYFVNRHMKFLDHLFLINFIPPLYFEYNAYGIYQKTPGSNIPL